jgi:hypothetical protein
VLTCESLREYDILSSTLIRNSVPHSCGFYPSGSGTGRVVLAASFLFPFKKLVGIEILEGLHNAACEIETKYSETIKRALPADDPRSQQRIDLHCASFLDFDWQSDADLVFANSTCFDDALMDSIAEQGIKLRDGTLIVTFTKPLTSPYYQLLYAEQHLQSWGQVSTNRQSALTMIWLLSLAACSGLIEFFDATSPSVPAGDGEHHAQGHADRGGAAEVRRSEGEGEHQAREEVQRGGVNAHQPHTHLPYRLC